MARPLHCSANAVPGVRSQSATTLMAGTRSIRANPEKDATSFRKEGPGTPGDGQADRGGVTGTPTPKKLSVASKMITRGTWTAHKTSTGVMALIRR